MTGKDGTYAEFEKRNDDAHTSAIIADVALGVGVVAALATVWLYFGRTKTPDRAPENGALRVGPGGVVGTF